MSPLKEVLVIYRSFILCVPIFLLASKMFGKSITHSGGRRPLSAEQVPPTKPKISTVHLSSSKVFMKTPMKSPPVNISRIVDEEYTLHIFFTKKKEEEEEGEKHPQNKRGEKE